MRTGFPGFMSAALPTREVFTPVDISGLAAWYDATDFSFVTKDGSNLVSNWGDKSSGGNNATATSDDRPLLQANEQNSLPTINFDGSQQMDLPSGLFSIPNGNSTLFIVSQRASESGGAETIINLSDGTAADFFIIYAAVAGSVTYKSRDGAGGTVTNTGNTLTNYNIFRGRRSGTTQALAVNGGTEVTNASGVSSAGIDSGDIGASNNDNLLLTGNVGEIIIYNTSLSTANILLVETYLANKWGLALA
jgi:hypothetical protein